MEENIEKPLSLDKIARATGISRRQIERLFRRHLDCVPKRYYLEMRLRRARELLLQTAMPIMDITTSCGFQSPPHFSRCYRKQFGHPPSAERQIQPVAGSRPPLGYVRAGIALPKAHVVYGHAAVAKRPVRARVAAYHPVNRLAETT